MDSALKRRFLTPFMWLIIVVGALAILVSAYYLPISQLDARFLILSFITICFGSRLSVKIPRTKGDITVSDTFLFLIILLYGGEAAVLVGAVESLCAGIRVSKKKITALYNPAQMALSTYLTVRALHLCFGSIAGLTSGSYSNTFVIAICVMAFVQYVVNSALVATCIALRINESLWSTWKNNFLWTSITYFAGASAAGIIAKLSGVVGFYAFLAVVPIIAIIYFTYWTYLKKVEVSAAQAEQAERHLAALQESEERFRSAFDYAAIGMAMVAPEGRWLQVNRSLCEIVGYTEQELLSKQFQDITHPDDIAGALVQINQLLKGEMPSYQMEKRYYHKNGHEVWVLLSVSLVRNTQNDSSRLIFQIQDITDRKRAEGRLLHDAFHDALTGLPNRALFIDHLKLAVDRAKRRAHNAFAVLFLDLDRFKIINDSLGHMVGDQLLIGIARRLEQTLRPGDTVARLGGDEFTVLLEDINEASEAIEVAERLQKRLSLPFNIDGHEVFTTVSIGIAPSTTGYDRPEDLLRDADTAMYRAKSLGKARHEVFDKAMHDRAMDLLQLETELRRALDRNDFLLYYQPIVSLESGKLRGFEALVRWHHPERGMISPQEFIPIAEENGLIAPLGQWVLREACRQMRAWQEQFPGHGPLLINVNLSGKQFTQLDLIEQVNTTLQQTELPPESLKLEITESTVMENTEKAIRMLDQLRSLGVKLSIDDFGTGYSSLSYLHRFPIDTLKIDRSFVGQMDSSSENAEIVRTIVMLARNLGMDVVAEGVETQEQLIQLKEMGCETGQGYLFSKPVDAAAAEWLLSHHSEYSVETPSLNTSQTLQALTVS